MRRLPDWQARLLAYCVAVQDLPFRYGHSDCFCFASGAVKAMTGASLFPEIEGAYASRFGMLRALRKLGHRSLKTAAEARAAELGWPAIDESQAIPGDIVLLPGTPSTSLGIAWEGGVLGQSLTGLALVPPGHALGVWRVPFDPSHAHQGERGCC